MKNTKVSKRYAKALLDISLESNFLEMARADMETVLQVYSTSKEFRLLMNNPVISASKKALVIQELFSPVLSKGSMMYLKILVQKRREMNVGTIAAEFLELYKEHKNIRSATLKTAVAVDEGTRKKIIAMIRERFSCEVELNEEISPNLIGGFVLQIGDYQFDTSVLSELNQLRKQFQENVYKKEL
ncbi:MAG: ATP synthase F1 subunit delta [Bacteroidales bacterium]